MGHLSRGHGVYGNLQKRLDRFMIGAPPAREIFEILKLLYTEQEAFIASRMPIIFSSLSRISRLTGVGMQELVPLLAGIRNVVNAITRVKPLKDYFKKEKMRSRFLQALVAR